MSEMVEKVAEAIWKAESLRAASKPRSVYWQDLGEEAQSKYLPVARAAIEALKAPTSAMIEAARPYYSQDPRFIDDSLKDTFSEMIDAALKD